MYHSGGSGVYRSLSTNRRFRGHRLAPCLAYTCSGKDKTAHGYEGFLRHRQMRLGFADNRCKGMSYLSFFPGAFIFEEAFRCCESLDQRVGKSCPQWLISTS